MPEAFGVMSVIVGLVMVTEAAVPTSIGTPADVLVRIAYVPVAPSSVGFFMPETMILAPVAALRLAEVVSVRVLPLTVAVEAGSPLT